MAKSRNQKAKILVLEHLLCETGENRAVTMQEFLISWQNVESMQSVRASMMIWMH